MTDKRHTSWEKQGAWYNTIVGKKGHYYHEKIVIPGTIRLLNLTKKHSLLDLGCGQGVLARAVPQIREYIGIDLASSLIAYAKKENSLTNYKFITADATRPLPITNKLFTHVTAILSLQNMQDQDGAIKNAAKHLVFGGSFVFVLNHPSFRIPKYTAWGIRKNAVQYRSVDAYMSSLKIPITMHPGENISEITWSFHHPLSFYAQTLKNNGLLIETIEEWVSDKVSVGKAAKMENTARKEIPMFMAIRAVKR